MYKYSVIVPIYNMESYLEKSIKSVIGQNRCDVQLVLVNDGSKDRSLEICMQYESENVLIINKENSGSMDSWIQGVNSCSGEYICFLDSDDMICENYFTILDKYVDKYDMVIFDFYRKYKNECIRARVNNLPYGEISNEYLGALKKDYFSNYKLCSCYRWDKVIRAEIIKNYLEEIQCRIVYFEDMISGVLNLLNVKNAIYIDEALYFYRMRRSSVSHGKELNNRIFWDNLTCENELMRIVDLWGYNEKAKYSLHLYFLFHYARYALRNNNELEYQRVTLRDILSINGVTKKIILAMYKIKLKGVYNIFNNLYHKVKNEKKILY